MELEGAVTEVVLPLVPAQAAQGADAGAGIVGGQGGRLLGVAAGLMADAPVAVEVVLGAPAGLHVERPRRRWDEIGEQRLAVGCALAEGDQAAAERRAEHRLHVVDGEAPLDAGGAVVAQRREHVGGDGLADDGLGRHDHQVATGNGVRHPGGLVAGEGRRRRRRQRRPLAGAVHVEVEVVAEVHHRPLDRHQESTRRSGPGAGGHGDVDRPGVAAGCGRTDLRTGRHQPADAGREPSRPVQDGAVVGQRAEHPRVADGGRDRHQRRDPDEHRHHQTTSHEDPSLGDGIPRAYGATGARSMSRPTLGLSTGPRTGGG